MSFVDRIFEMMKQPEDAASSAHDAERRGPLVSITVGSLISNSASMPITIDVDSAKPDASQEGGMIADGLEPDDASDDSECEMT